VAITTSPPNAVNPANHTLSDTADSQTAVEFLGTYRLISAFTKAQYIVFESNNVLGQEM
jgi:hypothetical protein